MRSLTAAHCGIRTFSIGAGSEALCFDGADLALEFTADESPIAIPMRCAQDGRAPRFRGALPRKKVGEFCEVV